VTTALATAYDLTAWHDLFVAAAGATAALSGLIFVGLSVNIKAVLDIDEQTGRNFLSGRAIEALVDLVIVLVVSLVALTPSIARGALAAVILATAVISGISPVRALRSGGGVGAPDGAPKGAAVGRLVVAAALAVLLVLAGVTLAAGSGGGLDWLPTAFVLAIVIAALNAWVLLVEILR
jgi:modulator of FtsH protease